MISDSAIKSPLFLLKLKLCNSAIFSLCGQKNQKNCIVRVNHDKKMQIILLNMG